MKFVFATIISMLFLTTYGQQVDDNFTITGRVLDAETHMPLQFVTVTLQGKENSELIGDISSKDGTFELVVPNGKYYFIAESLSFKPFIINILNINQDYDLGTIELSQNIEELQEVEVIAKEKLVDYQSGKKVYSASKDIANIGGSAITVLENTPSVSVNEEGKISVRGSTAQVLVNGKPYGGLQNNSDILSIIPASSISKVEILTRSAKYDAEGGEIINIILKKNKSDGYKGSIEAHVGLPDNDGLSTFINYKTEKVNIYSTASFNHNVKIKDTEINQIFLDNNQLPYANYNQLRDDYRQRNSLLLNFGSDFYLDKKNTLTTSLLYTNSNKNYYSNLYLNDFQPVDHLIKTSDRKSEDDIGEVLVEAFANFNTKFNEDGHELSIHLNYDKSSAEDNNHIKEFETFPSNSELEQDSDKNQTYNNYYFKADYTLPLKNNSKLEAGFKSNFRIYKNDFSISQLDPVSGQYIELSDYENIIDYYENIYAFYANYSKEYDKFSYALGLRTELSYTQIEEELNHGVYKNDYTNWFPSATLNYSFENNSTISIYYAPYITRPTITELNPFNSFTDERFQQLGNPFLQPYYTNYFLIEYQKDFNKLSMNLAAYYSHSKDRILFVFENTGRQTADGFDIYTRFPVNLGTLDYTGLELELTYSPNNKLRFYTSISPYISDLSDTNNGTYDYQNTVWFTKLMAMYRVTNTFKIQLYGEYQTAIKTAVNEIEAIKYMNATASKDILNGNATITFRANDIFHSREYIYNTIEANTISNRTAIFDTQYLLSFTYRFNKASKRNSHNRAKEINKNIFEFEEGK